MADVNNVVAPEAVEPEADEQVLLEQEGAEVPEEALVEGQGEEDAPGGGDEGAEEDPEAALYNEAEFQHLDPFDVDPDKLPGAAQVVHKRYMEIYRQQILPELQQLRALRDKVTNEARPQGDPRESFIKEVKARAARSLGVNELDEYNQEHSIEVSRQAALLQAQLLREENKRSAEAERSQRIDSLRVELAGEMSDFENLNRYAGTEINNLPLSKAQKVMADMKSGDPSRIRAVYKMFAERRQASAVKKPPEPPVKVMRAGGGERSAKSWDMNKFSSAGSDAQAQMLKEMGLVDE